ncbi:MAG TPA: polyprenyl diphosphate synthase [Patescibacteria group bacterium]
MKNNTTDNSVPTHLAIICDGNRRWARDHKLQVFKGHEKAVNDVFEPLIEAAAEWGIKYLTFWIFSTENWDRDQFEIEMLMNLFRSFFSRQIEELHQKGVRVNMIGRLSDFAPDIQAKIKEGMEKTKDNKKITVTLAMSYGGRDEILRAVNELVADRVKSSRTDKVTKEELEQYLDTYDMPDPDFVVRTSGEQRTSGFLLWQADYAEWYFPEWHFPEFTPEKLDEVIEEYQHRQRRFGR